MKKLIKGLIPNYVLKYIEKVETVSLKITELEGVVKDLQRSAMWNSYRQQYSNLSDQKDLLRANELSVYSQNGEDGILLYIFSKIGAVNFTFVEFGIEDGKQCNTANLSFNLSWKGLLIEGSERFAELAKESYKNLPKIKVFRSFVTAENINNILVENQMSGEIDLLSLDIDGNDYWVWKAIDKIDPRVVVIEYNALFGNDKSITVPYDPGFARFEKHPTGYYHGASLIALTKLAHEKGYWLVGCDSKGCNAFFVKKDIAVKFGLWEIEPSKSYYPLSSGIAVRPSSDEAFKQINDLPFIEI